MKIHRKDDGTFGECRARERPCPKGEAAHRDIASRKELHTLNESELARRHGALGGSPSPEAPGRGRESFHGAHRWGRASPDGGGSPAARVYPSHRERSG